MVDPKFHTPGNIDLLISTELFFDIVKYGQLRNPLNT